MTAITIRNLTLGYDRHPAVHHLDGRIEQGDMLAVIGPNGAGKSTLLKGLAGAIAPLGGTVEMPRLGRHGIAYLPQAAELDRSFPITVFELVAMGLWRRSGLFGGLSKADRETVRDALAAVGLTGFERRAIGTLSGGQMQRMLFARLLLQDARVILWMSLSPPSTPAPAPTSSTSCAAGTPSIARSSQCSTTWRRCGRPSRARCCWRAGPLPGARRRMCSRPKTCWRRGA